MIYSRLVKNASVSQIRSVILLAVPVIAAIVISVGVQASAIANPEKFRDWLAQFGPFVILVYILIQSLTIIVAPIGGFFAQVAVISLFPPLFAWGLIYLVVTPLYIVNFYLARRWGRPLVQKIIGKNSLQFIDKYAKDAGWQTLLVFKLFQGGLFDYVSYAAGLTTISFRVFVLINVLAGIPATFLAYFIFTRFENKTQGIVALFLVAYAFSITAIYLHRKIRRH